MTLRRLAGVAVLTVTLTGCDRIKEIPIPSWVPFIGKKAEVPIPVAAAPTDETPADTATPAPAPQPPVQTQVSRPRVVAEDEPWTPVDTGTVTPGMTREQVISLWGVPVAERTEQTWTYLYFRNGCEHTCGTFDLVLLQGGQVVDAVVRAPGHSYSGESSSPPGKLPQATPPAGAGVGGNE